MIEKWIDDVLAEMTDLSAEQLQHLSNVLTIKLHGFRIVTEQTKLVVSERHWEKALRTYIATKRLENCADGTLENYNRCIRMMMQTINKRLKDITANDLRFYLARYQEIRKVSLSYMETLRHYILAFFTWLADEGYIDRNPARRIRKIKVPEKIRKAYTAEEREILKCHAKTERDLAILELLYSSAARVGEVVAINRSDVDFLKKEICIYGQKGKKERVVYLSDIAAYHLKNYLKARIDDNPALFVGEKKPYSRLKKGGIQAMLRKMGKDTGIHAHPHKFRRSFITDAAARGMPLQELQAYAGHAKPDTTMIYCNVGRSAVRASFGKLMAG